eukprot:5838072-Alexandrium_andersonii.AAC.1
MSASLVGSEMCIRDRSSATRCQTLASSGGTLCMSNLQGVGPTCGRRWTVSYTHLTLPTICSV